MKPEFDKEIDALLRKAASGGTATAPVLEPHLDADEISMFAENALPDTARSRVVGHMADCDRCRTILANVITLNAESDPTPAAVPSASVEVAADQTGSWLSGLFSTRNLAFGFGAVALLFAGFIGFAVIQNMNPGGSELAKADSKASKAPMQDVAANSNAMSADNSTEDSLKEPEEELAGADEGQSKPMMVPDNTAITGKDIARPQKAPADDSFADRRDISGRRANKPATEKNEAREVDLAAADMESASQPPPVAASVPAPTVSVITPRGGVARTEAEPKRAKERVQDADKKVGNTAAAPARKTINGKTFTRRNGTWFDSAYKNQATTNIRRGTTEFQALDAGVRSIADQLSGTVVVVWKAKALKIQ